MSNTEEKGYEVLDPNDSFKNKRYVDWVQDWSNWFYQIQPERYNNGDVVFLRSNPVAEGINANEAMVMIGNESMEITEEQRVLVPIITATYVSENPSDSTAWMYGMVRSHILAGDCPPLINQIKINGKNVCLPNNRNISDYEVETPVFNIYIPDESEGKSLKSQVEMPIQASGFLHAVTRGYFVILKFNPKPGSYYIECKATGSTTANGPYHVSLFYHIIVKPSFNMNKSRRQVNPPDRLGRNIGIRVLEKHDAHELTDEEFNEIQQLLKKGDSPNVNQMDNKSISRDEGNSSDINDQVDTGGSNGNIVKD